ncbi:hypothetical protein BD560DRAFT_407992 [Blakeslea trispora]|nr:hypothetical protein BD560DRAFT_407992 [Blakeslea trispora]
MSEIDLSQASDCSSQSIMVNAQSKLDHKSTSTSRIPPMNSSYENGYADYSTYAFEPVPVDFTPVHNYNQSTISRLGYYQQTVASNLKSVSSYSPTNTSNLQSVKSKLNYNEPSTNHTSMARVKEIITRANSVPTEFYQTEFLEYSKENYQKKVDTRCGNKRKRIQPESVEEQISKHRKHCVIDTNAFPEEEIVEEEPDDQKQKRCTPSNAEIRRQIHIQSEQKRRAQIKDGFDELRKHLPGCNIKKMSKAALLTRTIQQLQHMKGMQSELLSEVERLLLENESLKKYNRPPSTCAFF